MRKVPPAPHNGNKPLVITKQVSVNNNCQIKHTPALHRFTNLYADPVPPLQVMGVLYVVAAYVPPAARMPKGTSSQLLDGFQRIAQWKGER